MTFVENSGIRAKGLPWKELLSARCQKLKRNCEQLNNSNNALHRNSIDHCCRLGSPDSAYRSAPIFLSAAEEEAVRMKALSP